MRLIPWVCVLGLGLSGGSQAADIKCYVELANGQRVVLSGTTADASPAAVQDDHERNHVGPGRRCQQKQITDAFGTRPEEIIRSISPAPLSLLTAEKPVLPVVMLRSVTLCR